MRDKFISFTHEEMKKYLSIQKMDIRSGDRLALVDLYVEASEKDLYSDKPQISCVRIGVKQPNADKIINTLLKDTVINLDRFNSSLEYFKVYYRVNFTDKAEGATSRDIDQSLLELAGNSVSEKELINSHEIESSDEEQETTEADMSNNLVTGGFIEDEEKGEEPDSEKANK